MNDNLKEILLLNRMLMFLKLLSDNITHNQIYVKKIENDLKFVGARIDSLFSELLNNQIELKRYHKVYGNVLKKYYLYCDYLTGNEGFMESKVFDYKGIMSLSRDVKDHYDTLKNYHYNGLKKTGSNTQYINENEYTMLLSQLEE